MASYSNSFFQKRGQRVSRRRSVPRGKRVYVLGDVHGCADLLRREFCRIDEFESVRPHADTVEVLLGDIIDRGCDSRGAIEIFLERGKKRNVVLLKGNHEYLMHCALLDSSKLHDWISIGGRETLMSYGYDISRDESRGDVIHLQRRISEVIPKYHQDLLANLPYILNVGDYIFVHAGLRPGIPIAQQKEEDMIWIREPFLSADFDFGPKIVHGHSTVEVVDFKLNRINIDTGAWLTGRLTCLVLEEEQIYPLM